MPTRTRKCCMQMSGVRGRVRSYVLLPVAKVADQNVIKKPDPNENNLLEDLHPNINYFDP